MSLIEKGVCSPCAQEDPCIAPSYCTPTTRYHNSRFNGLVNDNSAHLCALLGTDARAHACLRRIVTHQGVDLH